METGNLPSPRAALRAATNGNVLHVSGGISYDSDYNIFTTILSWDAVLESWNYVGDLMEARRGHAVVAVSEAIMQCSVMP